MHNRFRSGLAVLVAGLLLVICTACKSTGVENASGYKKDGVSFKPLQSAGDKTPDPADTEGKTLVQENDYLILYYEESSAAVSVFDKRTGAWWFSNPQKQEGAVAASMSQLSVTTVSSQGVVRQYTSYADSLLRKQVEYAIRDGLRVTYTFGDAKPDLDSVPQKLTDERFNQLQERVQQAGGDTTLLKRRYVKQGDFWVRKDNLTADQAKKLRMLFESINYNPEELAADNAAAGLAASGTEGSGFVIPVEYRLEGDSLLVQVDNNKIHYPQNELITSLNILEYFGAIVQGEEGYFLIPDGSGAIVDSSPMKGSASVYTAPLYGRDYTLPQETANGKSMDCLLPVFGISRPGSGVIAVIEDNEASASIRVVKPGYMNSFVTVSTAFELNATENVGLTGDSVSKFYITSDIRYNGKNAIRYIFLNGQNSDYSGMANVYRDYLELTGKRQKLQENGDIPFFLETVGAVKTKVSTMGFVHDAYVPLTTYSDNINLLRMLKNKGVGNIQLILSGWMNGGTDQRLADNPDLLPVLGGRKGFKELLDFASDNGVRVYPQVLLNTFSTLDGLLVSNVYSSRTLGGEKSVISSYKLDTGVAVTDKDGSQRWIVTPSRQLDLSRKFLSGLLKTGATGVALEDISHTVYSDYNNSSEMLRQQALLQSGDIVAIYSKELSHLLLTSPNDHTARYSQLYTDVPSSSSSRSMFASSVPFYQMVYHGYADYSFEAMNFSADFRYSLLKCAEYGGYPKFSFTFREDERLSFTDFSEFYACRYTRWIDSAAEAYSFLNELLGPVRKACIVNHEKLKEGVYRTDYDNGISIYVNYTDHDAEADGITIKASDAARKERSAL